MTDFELNKQDELRQRRNVLFRNDIINRERLKAFRLYLFAQNQSLQQYSQTQQQNRHQQEQQQLDDGSVKHQHDAIRQNKHTIVSANSLSSIASLSPDRNRGIQNDTQRQRVETNNLHHENDLTREGNLRYANKSEQSQKQKESLHMKTNDKKNTPRNETAVGETLGNISKMTQKNTIPTDPDLEIKAAHFAHLRQHVMQDLSVWNSKRNADIIFVKRENRRGAYFLTFDKDAVKTAKVLGVRTKKLNIKDKKMQYVSIPEKRMMTVVNELSKRDLKTNIINTKGQNVPMMRRTTPSPSLSQNVQKPTVQPKLDVMESLDKNRQDSRRNTIHVESLSVTADSKGNWKVSGLVNGITVSAKSIEQADAVSYKKGEMTKECLAEKYNLHIPPKQETKVTRKNNMVRRYSLDKN